MPGADIRIAASTANTSYNRTPSLSDITVRQDAAYVYMTTNETIGGVQYKKLPETGNVPLVADMSSDILSASMDVNRFGLCWCTEKYWSCWFMPGYGAQRPVESEY